MRAYGDRSQTALSRVMEPRLPLVRLYSLSGCVSVLRDQRTIDPDLTKKLLQIHIWDGCLVSSCDCLIAGRHPPHVRYVEPFSWLGWGYCRFALFATLRISMIGTAGRFAIRDSVCGHRFCLRLTSDKLWSEPLGLCFQPWT